LYAPVSTTAVKEKTRTLLLKTVGNSKGNPGDWEIGRGPAAFPKSTAGKTPRDLQFGGSPQQRSYQRGGGELGQELCVGGRGAVDFR